MKKRLVLLVVLYLSVGISFGYEYLRIRNSRFSGIVIVQELNKMLGYELYRLDLLGVEEFSITVYSKKDLGGRTVGLYDGRNIYIKEEVYWDLGNYIYILSHELVHSWGYIVHDLGGFYESEGITRHMESKDVDRFCSLWFNSILYQDIVSSRKEYKSISKIGVKEFVISKKGFYLCDKDIELIDGIEKVRGEEYHYIGGK